MTVRARGDFARPDFTASKKPPFLGSESRGPLNRLIHRLKPSALAVGALALGEQRTGLKKWDKGQRWDKTLCPIALKRETSPLLRQSKRQPLYPQPAFQLKPPKILSLSPTLPRRSFHKPKRGKSFRCHRSDRTKSERCHTPRPLLHHQKERREAVQKPETRQDKDRTKQFCPTEPSSFRSAPI